MARNRADFIIIPRKQTKTGKTWFYVVYYDEFGERHKLSTGETVKTRAYAKASELFRKGELGKPKAGKTLFGDYFRGFWKEGSEFLRFREAKGRGLSLGSIGTNESLYRNNIEPYFRDLRLDAVTPRHIESWQVDILKGKRGLSNQTINSTLALLSRMFQEAERLGDIRSNPCRKVAALGKDSRERGILTAEEARQLFSVEWTFPCARTANLLAACTGLRIGEVLGLKAENVGEGKLYINRQVTVRLEYKKTKTRDERVLPITPALEAELRALIFRPDQFVFTLGDGRKPVSRATINSELFAALEKIGISPEERRRRNITFHSWRHFFASLMADNHVDKEVRMKVTGHKGEAMLDHYTHVDESFFSAVLPVQELVAGKSPSLSLGGEGEEG